ncbi:MAG: hypothetical protein M3Y54_11340 [Bacteroidota bacterium]|nr:hypothetical protein [Bacteroidota bacterium]
MRPIRFLYWNTDEKNESQEEVLAYVFNSAPAPDVVVLGECLLPLSADFLAKHGLQEMPYQLLEQNPQAQRQETQQQRLYFRANCGLQLTHLISEIEAVSPEPVMLAPGVNSPVPYLARDPRFVARIVLARLEVDGEPLLLACVHLPSRRRGANDEPSLYGAAIRYKTFLLQAGGRPLADFGHRIAVVGDFNMNPFDSGMVEPQGFFALNNRHVIRQTRDFQFAPEVMFYNPCWALLSDFDPVAPDQAKPSGSLYFTGAPSKKLYWHLFDQVVLSYQLANRFVHPELRLVAYPPLRKEAEKSSREGASYSDHLPLQFTLNFGSDVD